MRSLDKYQEKHQRKLRWQNEKQKLAKKINNPDHISEETVNDAIDMIGGDEQGVYQIKCL